MTTTARTYQVWSYPLRNTDSTGRRQPKIDLNHIQVSAFSRRIIMHLYQTWLCKADGTICSHTAWRFTHSVKDRLKWVVQIFLHFIRKFVLEIADNRRIIGDTASNFANNSLSSSQLFDSASTKAAMLVPLSFDCGSYHWAVYYWRRKTLVAKSIHLTSDRPDSNAAGCTTTSHACNCTHASGVQTLTQSLPTCVINYRCSPNTQLQPKDISSSTWCIDRTPISLIENGRSSRPQCWPDRNLTGWHNIS